MKTLRICVSSSSGMPLKRVHNGNHYAGKLIGWSAAVPMVDKVYGAYAGSNSDKSDRKYVDKEIAKSAYNIGYAVCNKAGT